MTAPTTQSFLPSPSRRWLQVPAVAVGVVVLVAACGNNSNTKSAAQAPTGGTASAGAGAGAAGTAGSGARPGTTGKISQVNPTSIYVQETSSQVTVNYTATTTFNQTVTTTAAVLKAGDCVTATSAAARPSAAPSANPSATPTPATAITATAVTITSTSGTCTLGNRGNRTPGAFPSARVRASGAAGFAGRAGGGFGGAAFGSVVSVGNGSFVVSSTRAGKTTKVTVTTTPTTAFRQETTATKADLKAGLCATAIGTTDDTGAVTARTIALSAPGANGCVAGFGGFGRGFGGGAGSGTGAAG